MSLTAVGYLVGAGSMSLGVEAAGFKLKDIWETPGYSKNARCWDLNRPTQRHHIAGLSRHSSIFRDVYRAETVDLFYGNPPCGGVSQMGVGSPMAPTNQCMRDWIRMATSCQPRAILMESGYQLATQRFWPLLEDLTDHLESHCYTWWTWRFWSYRVGTPQLRQRMFLVATQDEPTRADLLDVSWDQAEVTTCGPWLVDTWHLRPSPEPVGWTLSDGREVQVTHHWWDRVGLERQAALKDAPPFKYVSPKQLAAIERKVEEDPENPAHWRELERAKARLWEDCPEAYNTSQVWQHLSWLDAAKPAPTMVGHYKFVHPRGDRLLTLREMATLMGFPMTWQLATYSPLPVIQGVPVQNARWAARRLREVMEWT